MSSHTPTPWVLSPAPHPSDRKFESLKDAKGQYIDELVDALRNLVNDWERVHGPIPEDHEAQAILAKLTPKP